MEMLHTDSAHSIATTAGRHAWRESTLGILTIYILNSYLFHNLVGAYYIVI